MFDENLGNHSARILGSTTDTAHPDKRNTGRCRTVISKRVRQRISLFACELSNRMKNEGAMVQGQQRQQSAHSEHGFTSWHSIRIRMRMETSNSHNLNVFPAMKFLKKSSSTLSCWRSIAELARTMFSKSKSKKKKKQQQQPDLRKACIFLGAVQMASRNQLPTTGAL